MLPSSTDDFAFNPKFPQFSLLSHLIVISRKTKTCVVCWTVFLRNGSSDIKKREFVNCELKSYETVAGGTCAQSHSREWKFSSYFQYKFFVWWTKRKWKSRKIISQNFLVSLLLFLEQKENIKTCIHHVKMCVKSSEPKRNVLIEFSIVFDKKIEISCQ